MEAKEFLDDILNQNEWVEEDNAADVNSALDFGYTIEEKRITTKRVIKDKEPIELGDQQVILEMTAAIRELSAEVKQLREQIKDAPQGYYPTMSISDVWGNPNPIEEHNIRGEPDKAPLEETTQAVEKTDKKKKRKTFSIIGSILFYLMLAGIVLGAFLLRSSSGGKPFTFAGYSAFTVLTSSMEEVIPKGSLIITKSVDANTLQIGDDITYMSGPTSTITHRIIGIEENYADTKARAFETKGVMNPNPDKELVPAANVVGKVIYHNKTIGDMANFLSKNWPLVVFIAVVFVILLYVLKWIFSKEEADK